jgi:hypothetical protein
MSVTIAKPTTILVLALFCALRASAMGGAQTEPLTRLPLYPGLHAVSTDAQDVCGTNVRNATYSPGNVNLATVDRWYRSHLRGFKMLHGTNRNYPYDVFVAADATASVTILGSGPKTGVEGVVYHRNSKPASLGNLTAWLDGSDPICR